MHHYRPERYSFESSSKWHSVWSLVINIPNFTLQQTFLCINQFLCSCSTYKLKVESGKYFLFRECVRFMLKGKPEGYDYIIHVVSNHYAVMLFTVY